MATDQTPDPTDVHPEHDRLTPTNIDDWSEEQIDRYNELMEAELRDEAESNRREFMAEQAEAVAALESAVDTGEDTTERVDIGETEVVVTTRLSGQLEQTLDAIAEADEDTSATAQARRMIDAITMLIVDDAEPDGEAFDYTDRAVWEAFYERNGIEGLSRIFNRLAEPTIERQEQLDFRGEERRGR